MPAAAAAPTVTPDLFTAAMAELPAAVTVLTTWESGGAPVGATLSAVSSLSLDPPLILACLAETSDTLRALRAQGVGAPLTLNVLADGQQDVAKRFAGKGADKFDAVAWTAPGAGAPEIEGVAVVVAGTLTELHPAGDHVIAIGRVERATVDEVAVPLVYHRRAMAPTPIERSKP